MFCQLLMVDAEHCAGKSDFSSVLGENDETRRLYHSKIVVIAHTLSNRFQKQETFGNFLDTGRILEYTQSKAEEGFNCKLLTFE